MEAFDDDLLNFEHTENPAQAAAEDARKRRVLIVAEQDAPFLQQRFIDSGYDASVCTAARAESSIKEFAPEAVVIEIDQERAEDEERYFALARKLRAEAATYALALVFVYHEEKRNLRNFALQVGADDYFALTLPRAELQARMDALFWRVEAGRRSASVIGDQRVEIDNFMVMLEAVRSDVRAGLSGTIALIHAATQEKEARDKTLAAAHGFLKLNLRRADAIAFYGPTALLIYLPRLKLAAASAALNRLRAEFEAEYSESKITAGLASFPEDGTDLESLISKAEMAAGMIEAARVEPAPVEEEKSASEVDEGEAPQHQTSVKADDVSADESVEVERSARAIEAAARELERRASGAIMPRRLLLTISNPARMIQVNSLVRAAGYEARAAFDAKQALDLLRIERPDLLLLDYELEGMDGLEMLRRLRKQNGGRLSLPVVMLLAEGSERERDEALELGAHSVVMMPYDPALMLDRVREAGKLD